MAVDHVVDEEEGQRQQPQRKDGSGWNMPSLLVVAFVAVVCFGGGFGIWHGLQAQGTMAVAVAEGDAEAKTAEKAAEQTAPLEEEVQKTEKLAEAEHQEHERMSTRMKDEAAATGKLEPTAASEPQKPKPKAVSKAQVKAVAITDKPQSDARNYSAAVLPNGMQAVAVQDTRALFAAYSVAVMVGSYDDPLELPGLSHFCEHMLFLGTKRFPNATGWDDFMNTHGGSFNAFTASEVTDYFFQISNSVAEEAADRFADFFRDPLFTADYVEKEVRAVNSEHAKNVQDSMRRVYSTMQSLANEGSVLRKFATGDVDTLLNNPKKQGIDPVAGLKEHFKKHYCPARMRVVSFGPSSPEEQLGLMAGTFGNIEKRSDECNPQPPSHVDPPAWPSSTLGKWVDILGTSAKSQLKIEFRLPSVQAEYRSQPLDYPIWGLLFKGPGSPFEVLRDRLGLAEAMAVGADSDTTGSLIAISIDLTEEGRDNPDLVLDVLYGFLASHRQKEISEDVYLSITDADKLQWKWQEPDEPMNVVQTLSEKLTRIPAGDILWADQVSRTMAPKRAKELLNMLSHTQANAAFVDPRPLQAGKERGTVPGPSEVLELPHYEVKYAVRPVGEVFTDAPERWAKWMGLGDEPKGLNDDELRSALTERLNKGGIKFSGDPLPASPPAITGLPKDVTVEHGNGKVKGKEHTEGEGKPEEVSERAASEGPSVAELTFGQLPTKLQETPKAAKGAEKAQEGSEDKAVAAAAAPEDEGKADGMADSMAPDVWFRGGWTSNAPVFSPLATVQVLLRTPKVPQETSARDQIRMALYGALLGEEMDTNLATLSAVGVKFAVAPSTQSLGFSFSSVAPLLNKTISEVMKQFSKHSELPSAKQRFPRIVHELRTTLTSYEEMPITYAISDRNLLLSSGVHSHEELVKELDLVNMSSASESLKDMVLQRPLQLTALAMGNLEQQQAHSAVSAVTKAVSAGRKAVHAEAGMEVEKLVPVVALSGPVELRKQNPRKDDPNDAVVVSIVAGVSTVESRVRLGLLGELLGNVAFTELRTAMQLGYVANGGMVEISNVLMLSCVVQGTKLDADDMEAAVQHAYTKVMPATLAAMTEEQVDQLKNSFIDKLIQAPFHTGNEIKHFWGIASNAGTECFGLIDEVVNFLKTSVTKESLIQAYNDLVLPASGVRRMLTIKYFSKEPPARPDLTAAGNKWSEQGVSEDALPLLRREYEQTLQLSAADAAARGKILESAGGKYFPPDVNCKRQKEEAPPQIAVSQLEVSGMAKRRVEAKSHSAAAPQHAGGRIYKGWRHLSQRADGVLDSDP